MTSTSTADRIVSAVFCVLAIWFLSGAPELFAQKANLSREDSVEKQLQNIKAQMEQPGASPLLIRQYDWLVSLHSDCTPIGQVIKTFGVENPLAPTAAFCVNGSLALTDPTYSRPLANSTGSGLSSPCSLSGSATAAHYDVYSFNLTGCAAFPTVVTAQLCGPAGCSAPAPVDTVLTLYRNVPAGDPLTANGGLPGVFNPASSCTNARALNDDSGATPTSPGGSTCNQLNTADCLAQCPVSLSLSEFKRSVGNGRFTIVLAGFGNTTVGNYNLYVDAPGAGCSLALAPTAAGATISGRVLTSDGYGIGGATISLSGGDFSQQIKARTNQFGYYTFENIPVGLTYILTAGSKQYAFVNSTRVVNLMENIAGEDFIAAP